MNILNLNGTHAGTASRIVVSTPTQSALFQQPKDSSLLDNGTEEDTNATFIMNNNDGADNDKKNDTMEDISKGEDLSSASSIVSETMVMLFEVTIVSYVICC